MLNISSSCTNFTEYVPAPGEQYGKLRRSKLLLRSSRRLGLCRLGGIGKTTWSRVSCEKRLSVCVRSGGGL